MKKETLEVGYIVVNFSCLLNTSWDVLENNEKNCGAVLLYLINDVQPLAPGVLKFWLNNNIGIGVGINNNANQYHAEWLGGAQNIIPNVIPNEWQGFYLIFAGTRWSGEDKKTGDKCVLVPSLIWESKTLGWEFFFWNLDEVAEAIKDGRCNNRFRFVHFLVPD